MQKKVLIMQPFLSYGGAEQVSIGIAKYLKKNKITSKIITLMLKKEDIRDINKIDLVLPNTFWQKIFKLNNALIYIFGFPVLFLLTWCESDKATLLNPHNFPTLWIAIVIGKIKKIPVYWTVHNFPQSKLDFFNVFFAKYCDKIIAVSPKIQKIIYQKYKLKSEVSYPVIDYDYFSKGKKINLNHESNALLVTRITKNKNVQMAIDAVKGKNVNLLIVGDGNIKNFKKNKNVEFIGYKNQKELRNLYSSIDFLILPSYQNEGFNLVPFEAGCLNKPSIVIKGSGADEVIKKYNLGLVSKPNLDSLINCVELMLQNKKFKIDKWVSANLSENNYKIYA